MKFVLFDTDDIYLKGLESIIVQFYEHTIAYSSTESSDIISVISDNKPDVLLINRDMLSADDLYKSLQSINETSPETNVILMMDKLRSLDWNEMESIGVRGVFVKGISAFELVSGFGIIAKGQTFYCNSVASLIKIEKEDKRTSNLITERECEVLRLVAKGYTSKDISVCLGISEKTVSNHRANLRIKLGAKNVADLLKIAVDRRIIEY